MPRTLIELATIKHKEQILKAETNIQRNPLKNNS